MIKKIYLICVLLLIIPFYISCGNKLNNAYNLNTTVFVDSIGIEYNVETKKYTLYYHSPSSFSLITSEMGSGSTDNTYHIAKTECDSIYEGIKKISQNTDKSIVLSHVKSVVFSESYLSKERLKEFNEFIKTYKYMTSDFAVYATDDNIEDLFSFKDPDNNSYYSILTELDEVIPYRTIKYYEFANSIEEKHIPTTIQWIKKDDKIWSDSKDNLTSLHLQGIYLIDNDNVLKINAEEYKFILVLYNNYYTVINIDNISYTLTETKVKLNTKRLKIKSNVFSTNVEERNSQQLITKLEKHLITEFEKLYKYTSSNDFDLFLLQDNLYRFGKLSKDFDLKNISFDYEIKLKLQN